MKKALAAPATTKSAGRPRLADRDLIKAECVRLMEKNLAFHSGWSKADLKRALIDFAENDLDSKISETTVRRYLDEWLPEWFAAAAKMGT